MYIGCRGALVGPIMNRAIFWKFLWLLVGMPIIFSLWVYVVSFGNIRTPDGIQNWGEFKQQFRTMYYSPTSSDDLGLDAVQAGHKQDTEESMDAFTRRLNEENRRINEAGSEVDNDYPDGQ